MNIDDLSQRGLRRYLEPRCDCAPATYCIYRYIIGNGTTQFRLGCAECGRISVASIPHALIDDATKQAAPILRAAASPPCARCKSAEGSENHHWAPPEMFADWFDWPTSPLCRRCHAEWHRTLNEHQRRWREHPEP
jgi:hypothetical protein